MTLAGDNALVVGLAASRVAYEHRTQVILWGTVGAVLLRIVFAAVTVELLALVGLTLASWRHFVAVGMLEIGSGALGPP